MQKQLNHYNLELSFVTGTKYNIAFNGCHKCDQVGEKIGARTSFSEISGTLRTDESFDKREDPEHHNIMYKTLLETLPNKYGFASPVGPNAPY